MKKVVQDILLGGRGKNIYNYEKSLYLAPPLLMTDI